MRQLSSCEAGVSVGRLHMMWHSYIQLPATATELIATESTARSCHVCWLPRERHTNRHIKVRRRAVCLHAADRLALDFFNHSLRGLAALGHTPGSTLGCRCCQRVAPFFAQDCLRACPSLVHACAALSIEG